MGSNDVYVEYPVLIDGEQVLRLSSALTDADDNKFSFGVAARAELQLTDNAEGWIFGFVQFLRFQALDTTYRVNACESTQISLQMYKDNVKRLLLLDRSVYTDKRMPWYDPNCTARVYKGNSNYLSIPFNDTPAQDIPLSITDKRLKKSLIHNYLYHLWFRLEFTTVLAARSPNCHMFSLQSFDWWLDWNLQVDCASTNKYQRTAGNPLFSSYPDGKFVSSPSLGPPAHHYDIFQLFTQSFNMPPTVRSIKPNRKFTISHLSASTPQTKIALK
jgi:hypothetical protein